MADHVRNQIRDAVQTAVTGLATTGSNVYQQPAYNRPESQLPSIEIGTLSDQVDPEYSHQTSSGASYYRRLVLELVVKAKAINDAVQDTIDTIAKEIEVALYADETFGGLAKSIEAINADFEFTNEGDQPIGVMNMEVEILYSVRGGAPDAAQ